MEEESPRDFAKVIPPKDNPIIKAKRIVNNLTIILPSKKLIVKTRSP